MMFLHLLVNDDVSVTGEEEGDVVQPRRRLHAGVREVVGQYEELPEFPESSGDNRAHPGVLQYGTGRPTRSTASSVSDA